MNPPLSMSPGSPAYLALLPFACVTVWVSPRRVRPALLLAASYAFLALAAGPAPAELLAAVTAGTYALGLALAAVAAPGTRGALLAAGVFANFAALATSRAVSAAGLAGAAYFTVQAVAYLVDVVVDPALAERDPIAFALFLAFFPRVLMGPIERAAGLLPQLCDRIGFSYDAVRTGLVLFAWGLFKKTVVADRLGTFVDPVFGDVRTYAGLPALLAAYGYAFQLYCDFSGYTDMARGAARLFGLELAPNFDRPYTAASVTEFWRRWHMSFSRWLLDHVFQPLNVLWRGAGRAGTACALVATFALSGLWHGTGWTFAAWGVWHGLALAGEVWLGAPRRDAGPLWFRRVRTFHVVLVGWVFFRAHSLADAVALLTSFGVAPEALDAWIGAGGADELAIALAGLAVVLAIEMTGGGRDPGERLAERAGPVRWTAYLALAGALLLFAAEGRGAFLYARF